MHTLLIVTLSMFLASAVLMPSAMAVSTSAAAALSNAANTISTSSNTASISTADIMSLATTKSRIVSKCRTILNPYQVGNDLKASHKKNRRTKRRMMVRLTPSNLTSEFNRKRSTIITNLSTRKSYLFHINAYNELYLEESDQHISKPKYTFPRCTFRLNAHTAHPLYIKQKKDKGINTKINTSRIIKIRPSPIKSLYNGRRSTVIVDLGAKKYYVFMVDEKDRLSLQQITRNGDFVYESDNENRINNQKVQESININNLKTKTTPLGRTRRTRGNTSQITTENTENITIKINEDNSTDGTLKSQTSQKKTNDKIEIEIEIETEITTTTTEPVDDSSETTDEATDSTTESQDDSSETNDEATTTDTEPQDDSSEASSESSSKL